MLNRVLAKAAAVLLLFSFPVTMLPAQTSAPAERSSQAGVLYPQEGVKVKGAPVFTSTAVYAGDEIQTGALSTLLTGAGVTMQLKPHTSLKFGKAAELGCGGLVLVTRESIPVRLAGLEITPAGNPAKLEVDNAGGTATVSVKSGMATVNEAGQISTLREGQVLTRPAAQRCPVAPPAGKVPASASAFAGGNNLYWILGGVAGAGTVAGVLATRGEKRVSPSVP